MNTVTYHSPPYTGPSADALSASYHADREHLLDVALAATESPLSLGRVEVEALGAAVRDLDTLVVAADTERSADRRTIARIERDIAAAVSIRAAAHAEISEARDQLLEQQHTIERLRLDLAIADSLRTAALADRNDAQALAIRLAAENRTLRIQAGLNQLALTVTGRSAAELSAEIAAEQRALNRRRAAVRMVEAAPARTATIHQRGLAAKAWESASLVFDVSDTEIVDVPFAVIGGVL